LNQFINLPLALYTFKAPLFIHRHIADNAKVNIAIADMTQVACFQSQVFPNFLTPFSSSGNFVRGTIVSSVTIACARVVMALAAFRRSFHNSVFAFHYLQKVYRQH
jgi:hypothetical protein